jgi:hypothetical protein
MKVTFDHIEGWGKITKMDVIHSPCWATVEEESPDEMLENGWLPWQGKWFPARSVRYDLSATRFGKTTIKNSKKVITSRRKPTCVEYESIVHFYSEYKKFTSPHVFEEIKKNPEYSWLTFEKNEEAIGFVCYLLYPHSFVGVQFAWDYQEPGLSLGSVSTYQETILAQELGCRHYYLMGGYEDDSIYKSRNPGFEWWTGTSWSKDVVAYEALCHRDTDIILENHVHL